MNEVEETPATKAASYKHLPSGIPFISEYIPKLVVLGIPSTKELIYRYIRLYNMQPHSQLLYWSDLAQVYMPTVLSSCIINNNNIIIIIMILST